MELRVKIKILCNLRQDFFQTVISGYRLERLGGTVFQTETALRALLWVDLKSILRKLNGLFGTNFLTGPASNAAAAVPPNIGL